MSPDPKLQDSDDDFEVIDHNESKVSEPKFQELFLQQKNVLHLLKQKKTALLAKQKLLQPKEYVRIHMFFAEDGEDEGDVYDIPLQDGKVLVTDLQRIDSQVVSLSYWIPEKNRSRLLIPDQMGAITAPKNGWNANKLYAWMC